MPFVVLQSMSRREGDAGRSRAEVLRGIKAFHAICLFVTKLFES